MNVLETVPSQNSVMPHNAFLQSRNRDSSSFMLENIFRWFKFTLKPPYSIAHDKLRLAIWDTDFWTFWLKFGHKGP